MLGTLSWRLKEAWKILNGNKKNLPGTSADIHFEKDFAHLEEYVISDQELKNYLSSISIEFCFSEFGENRANAGGAKFRGSRLEPSLSSLRRFFPQAKYTVYSDFDLEIPGVSLKKIITAPIKNVEHPRHYYHLADYFKFKSLLESDADFCCALDSDMFVLSENIYRLVFLTQTFGACAAHNERNLLKKDMEISLDTKEIRDLSNGFGHSYNQSPMTLWKDFSKGRSFYEACCKWLKQEPTRASRAMWQAAKETGFSPYLLPSEFCVCDGTVGIGNEVMLHVGHSKVAEYYNIKL